MLQFLFFSFFSSSWQSNGAKFFWQRFLQALQGYQDGLEASALVLLQTCLGLAAALGCAAWGLVTARPSTQCLVSRQYLCQAALLGVGQYTKHKLRLWAQSRVILCPIPSYLYILNPLFQRKCTYWHINLVQTVSQNSNPKFVAYIE